MLKENTQYYTVTDLINTAISKSLHTNRSDQSSVTNLIINEMTYSNIWNAFVKWCLEQTESGQFLNIYPLGTMLHVTDKNYEGISLKLSDNFMRENELRWDDSKFSYEKLNDGKSPNRNIVQKLNLLTLANELNLRKNYVQTGLHNIFRAIGYILNSSSSCMIELGFLGNLGVSNRLTYHVPTKLKKESQFNKKATVKALMAKYWEVVEDKKPEEEQHTKSGSNLDENNIYSGLNFGRSSQASLLDKLKHSIQIHQKKREDVKFYSSDNGEINSINKYVHLESYKESVDIQYPELKKVRKPSKVLLVPIRGPWNLKDIVSSTFKKGEKIQSLKASPVLFNQYSNTKGAPFTSEKTQIPIAHRIASFYSLPLQNFVIDRTSKQVKKLHDEYFYKYKNFNFEIPADEQEEYFYIIGTFKDTKKVDLRRSTYKLYKSFCTDVSIPDSCLSEMKESLLVGIVKMCLRAYNLNDQIRYAELLNSLIKEIVMNYKDSMRQAILDYLLKHPEMREKLGIPCRFRKLPEYAEASVQRPSDNNLEWKRLWSMSKLRISTNLMIMSENITKVLKYFLTNIKKKSYFQLQTSFWTSCVKLSTFIENQKNTIETQKNFVNEDWRKYIESVLKENKIYKDQLIIYFKSVSALMSSQMRKSIISSLESFHKFIMNFKKVAETESELLATGYLTPRKVFSNQFNPSFPFEKSFIELEICPNGDWTSFCFTDELSDVHNKLVSLVSDLVKCSQEVERPDNIFIKNLENRSKLWEVSINDIEVSTMLADIDTVIKENLDVVNKVLDLYEPFLFVLAEKNSLETFRATSPKIEEIKMRIKFYEEKLQIMTEDMPDSLYMNMFKIDCSGINKIIREMLYDFIVDLLHHVRTKNINEKSKDLCENIEKLTTEMEQSAQDEKQLADLENSLEEIKKNTIPDYYNQYNNFLDWLFFYLDYDIYPIFPDSGKELGGGMDIQSYTKNVYSSVRLIQSSLEKFEQNLKNKRQIFELNLERLRKKVNATLDDLRTLVNERKAEAYVKLNTQDPDYIKALEAAHKEAKRAQDELNTLNYKENLLNNYANEDERIDQCLAELNPLINYIYFNNEFREIQAEYDSLEVRKLDFPKYQSLIERSVEVYESFSKILNPNLRRIYNNSKADFEIFKITIEVTKYVFTVIDILKFDNLEEDNKELFKDNAFYCKELYKLLFPEKDVNKAQETLKNSKLRDFITNNQISKNYKNTLKVDVERLVNEWESVKSMYDLLERIATDVDLEFRTENFKDKKFMIISHECYIQTKSLLSKSIKEIQDSINQIDNSKEKINILVKVEDYKSKLSQLLEIIDKLQEAQLLLEKHMTNSNILQNNHRELFGKLKQAEKDYKLLIEFINGHPKINSVLSVKTIFLESILSIHKLLNEIPISKYEEVND